MKPNRASTDETIHPVQQLLLIGGGMLQIAVAVWLLIQSSFAEGADVKSACETWLEDKGRRNANFMEKPDLDTMGPDKH